MGSGFGCPVCDEDIVARDPAGKNQWRDRCEKGHVFTLKLGGR